MKTYLRMAVSVALFLISWELLARSMPSRMALFPPVSRVALAFIDMARSGELIRDLSASLWRAIAGFVFGSVAGVTVGIVTGRIEVVDGYLAPLIQLFRPLPPVAIIPLIIVWFGIGEISKVFSIAFAVFFPVWVNTHIGAHSVPTTYLWSARTLNVRNPAVLWKVILPASMPYILSGLRTAVSLAFVMVFVSELAGASSGIGYQINVSYLAYRVDRMIAALIVLGCLGALADRCLILASGTLFPWTRLAQR